jgi:hypothetical protein
MYWSTLLRLQTSVRGHHDHGHRRSSNDDDNGDNDDNARSPYPINSYLTMPPSLAVLLRPHLKTIGGTLPPMGTAFTTLQTLTHGIGRHTTHSMMMPSSTNFAAFGRCWSTTNGFFRWTLMRFL